MSRNRHEEPAFTAEFRFYEELNDFLPTRQRQRSIRYRFDGSPGIKDPIEVLGIPHPEVELIVVNGHSVGFDYRLRNNDRVAVYPMFESFDVTPLVRLRECPLRDTAFVLDVHLGKLARYLRLLGFDCLYRNDYRDEQIIEISVRTRRVILTRDRRLLYPRIVTHGYWLRSTAPREQVREVLQRFDLGRQIRPFHRCLRCNGRISPVDKAVVLDRLEPLTRRYYERFYRCNDCGKVYWEGSHFGHLNRLAEHFIQQVADAPTR